MSEKGQFPPLFGGYQTTSNDQMTSSLDIFAPQKVNPSLKGHHIINVKPLNLVSEGPIEFVLPQMSNYYTDLKSTEMLLQLRVYKTATKKPLEPKTQVYDDDVSFINNLFSSIWSSVEITIGDKAMPDLHQDFVWMKSYIENMLSFGVDAKRTQLTTMGFTRTDAPGEFHQTRLYNRRNAGTVDVPVYEFDLNTANPLFQTNSALIDIGPIFMIGVPCADIFSGEKVFPPNMKFGLKFNRMPSDFVLMYDDVYSAVPGVAGASNLGAYQMKIEAISLNVKYIEVHPKIAEAHQARFRQKHVCELPFTRTIIRKWAFASGLTTAGVVNAFSGGVVPKYMLLMLADSEAVAGHRKKNPLEFCHYDMSYAHIRYNGALLPTPDIYRPNEELRFLREYKALCDSLGFACDKNGGNSLTLEMFSKSCFLLPFQFCSDACGNAVVHPCLYGLVDIEIGFGKPLPKNVTLFVYSLYDATMFIDERQQVVTTLGGGVTLNRSS